MTRLVRPVCVSLVLLFLSALSVWGQEPKQQAPAIVIEEPNHDFGQVAQGAVIQWEFRVLNKGDGLLEIKSVKPG